MAVGSVLVAGVASCAGVIVSVAVGSTGGTSVGATGTAVSVGVGVGVEVGVEVGVGVGVRVDVGIGVLVGSTTGVSPDEGEVGCETGVLAGADVFAGTGVLLGGGCDTKGVAVGTTLAVGWVAEVGAGATGVLPMPPLAVGVLPPGDTTVADDAGRVVGVAVAGPVVACTVPPAEVVPVVTGAAAVAVPAALPTAPAVPVPTGRTVPVP